MVTDSPAHLQHPLMPWLMVFTSAVMCGVAFGLLVSVSVFLKPLELAFSWERADTSLAYSSGAFMTGVFGIFMGRLVDRISPRPIAMGGVLMVGLSQVLLSQLGAQWQLYLLYGLLLGGLGNGSLLVPLMTNVGFWFERHRGMALGIVMAGQSLGGSLMPMLTRWLLAQMDWRDAYLVLGVGALVVLVPLSWIIRPPPGLMGARSAPPAPMAAAGHFSQRRIQLVLSVAIIFCCVCMSIPVIHSYPLALEAGIGPLQASWVIGTLMAMSMVGRVGIGKIADYIGGVRALLLASGIQTVVIFWFARMDTLTGFLLVAVPFALGYGGVIPSYAIIIREMVSLRSVGRVTGVVFFFGNFGMALGGFLGGAIYDLTGGYPMAFALGAVSGVINLVIVGTFFLRLRAGRAAAPAA